MASKKLMATAELFLNTKSAKKDAQIFINDLKGKLQDIETAADKMTVFKDMVAYIAQVDKALSALKANNKDAFSHMFDGIDVNLKKQLEGIFGVDGVKLGQLDVLRDLLGNLNLKSSINEIKGFAKELNDLFTSVGMDAPFKDINKDFFGRTNTDHLQRLATELAKFATVWEGLNAKLAEGFNFGGGSGSGGPDLDTNDALSEIQILINNIEKKNKELLDAKERFEKILEEFKNVNTNGISDNYKIDLTEESVKNLTVEYDRLQGELENADASSEVFYNTLTKLVETSLKLKKAFADVSSDEGLKSMLMNASAGTGTGESTLFGLLSRYARTKDPVNKDIQKLINKGGLQTTVNANNALIEELKASEDINALIQKRVDLYNQLSDKLREYDKLQRQEFDTDEEEDENLDKLAKIEQEIKTITKSKNSLESIQGVLAELSEDGAALETVLQKLYKTLGMETPDAFKTRLENLVSESKAAMSAIEGEKGGSGHGAGGSGSGRAGSGGTVTAEVDFTSLENTIRTEAASISDKLDNSTFKVELVNDQTKDIQSAINDIVTNVQQIRDHFHVDQNQTDVNNMKKNLLQLLDVVDKHNEGRTSDGGYQEQELSALLMSDGSFSVNHGDKGRVSWGHVAESLVANLNKTLLGDFHSHPLREFLRSGQTYVNDSFSSSQGDLGAFRFSQSLGAQVAGMITGNILRVLDLSAIPKDTMARMHKELTNIEQQYLNSGRYSQYIGKTEDGRLAAIAQSTLEGRHEVTKVFESMMYDALKRVGYSESYIDNQLFKKYNLTDDAQLTDLATRLVQLVSSAEQAIPPIDRLSEIILQFGGNAIGKDADVLFEAYNKGELKASDVFNDLVPDSRVSEAAIQTLMNINSAGQMSPIETLLTNISSILSNINTIVGNIEANNKLSSEQQLNNAIKDITDLKAGIVNDNLSKGVDSIYTGKDATNYRYQDTKIRAATAIKDFTDDLKIKSESDGFAFSESALKDAFELVDKFKTAFTYLQDFGKQTDLLTGGRNNIGLYVEPGSGKILDSYDTLSESLINNDTLNALINYLGSIKENQFSSVDLNDSQQLESVFERLYMVVDDLSSTISNFNGNQSEQKLPKMDDVFDSSNGDNIIDVSHDITNLDTLINKVKEVASEIRGIATEVSNIISNVSNVFKSSQDNIMPVAGDEKSELERLQAQLLEVKAAVDAKTRAFEEEYVTVDGVVESEIASLQELINKLLEVVRQVGLVETSLKNIGDNSVQLNVGDSEAQLASLLTSSDITKEMSELEALTARVIEVKNAVLSKTKAFVDEGNVVGQVVGKEISALMKLEGIVNGVATKVDVLTTKFKGINKEATSGSKVGQTTSGVANKQTTKSSKDASPVDAFANNLLNQKNAFNEYRESLRDVDYLSAELRAELDRLGISLQQVGDQSGLDAFKKDLEAAKKEISIKKAAHETSGLGSINSTKKNLSNIFNNLTFEQRDGVKKEYDEAIEQLERYAVAVKDGKTVELQAINDTTAALLQKLETIKKANQAVKDAEKTQEKNATFGDTAMINAKAKYNTLDQAVHGNRFKDSRAVIAAWDAYVSKYKELEQIQDELSKKPSITSDDEAKFKAAKDACNDYAKSLNKMLNDSTKLSSEKANKSEYTLGGDFNYDDENARKAELEEFVNTIDGANIASMQFKKGFKEAMFEVDNGDGTVTKMTAKFTAARNEIVAMAGDTKKTTGLLGKLWTEFKGKVQSIFTYLTASFSLHEVWSVIKRGVNYVREIDTALTELKKVTDETDASYNKFLKDMAKTGSVIGATVKDLTTMAADWAKLGYSMEQAGQLAKSTAILLNVSEFQDANAASEALISTIQAFGYAADESMHVVDVLNEVGNNYAISSDGIATALQDSASALMEGGNNLEQAVALVAAANKVVQDPNSVGSALRTISLRLRGTSVEILEQMGEETEGVIESTSKLQAKIKALSGVNILTDAGEYKDTYTILKEIGTVWEEMSDIDQAALLELMAGKNRANTLSAILSNMQDLEGAYNDALKAEGSALKENEAYLNSIQGRIDLFNNAVQTMWMNLISTDTVKGVVDLGTDLIKLLDTTHGKILSLAAAFLIYKRLHDKTTFTEMYNGVIKAITSLTTATNSVTEAEIKHALASKGLKDEKAQELLVTIGLIGADGKLITAETGVIASKLADAYATGKLTAAQYLAAASTLGLKESFKALGNVLKANKLYLIAAAVAALALAFDHFHTTVHEAAEAAKEAFTEIQNVVEATESTIQSLESELSTLQDKIDELDGKKLSFAEDKELERLKDQRAELDHSLRVQKQLLELQRDASNKQAVATMKAYTKAASAGAEETQKTAKTWGTIGGVIAGVVATAGILLAPLTGGASLAATLGMSGTTVAGGILAGGAALGIAGNKAGEAIGSKSAANDGTYDSWYETYTKALEAARKDEQEAFEKYQNDSSNIKKLDKWQEAQQRTTEIETEMYEHLSQMQEYYSGLEYGISAEIDRELDTWYNFLDKLAISEKASGAEVTALDRIFGENASQEIQDIKQQILDASKSGQAFNFTAAINSSQELSSTLEYLGLDVKDVIDYFTQLGEAAEEAANDADTSFVDVATDISKVADAISGVIDALGEFEQSGILSHSTVLSLAEIFNTDELKEEFDKYLGVMLSGNASLEDAKAATSALAQKYLENAITAEPLTSEKKNAMINILKNLGIANAGELIEHELQKSAIAEIGNALAKDSTLTSSSEAIQEIIDKYGVEIQAVDELIAKLREKQTLESNINGIKDQEEAYKKFANEYDAMWRYAQNLSQNMPEAPTNPYDLTLANTASSYAANPNAYPSHSYAGAYAANAANMRKAYMAPDGSTMYLTDAEYADMVQKYEEYQKKVQELQEYWNKLQALQSSAEGQKWLNADGTLKEGVDAEFEKAYNDIKADIEAKETEIDAEFTLEYELKLKDKTDPNTLSALQESVDKYKSILAETAEVIADGQVVTEEYKASLVDLGISINELNTYFDENNPLVVKNAKGLRDLVDGAKKNASQNIKLAKSQAQLEYYELTKELTTTLKATDKLDDATKDTIKSTLKQIDAVKLAIYQYEMLEDSLLGATNAFEEFAKAQEIDAMNTYGDSYVEMAQTMYDAIFKTGEVGSEAFWAAVEATVPDNVYKKFYEEADQLQAVIDYLGTHVFPTLTLEEDQFSLGYESMEDFVQECLKVGVFVGDLSNFDLADGMNFEKAIELLDMTEAQAYALFSTLDKFNGNNFEPSFLMRLDDSLAGRITLITSELEELNRQKLALLEDGITADEQSQIDAINKKLNQSESAMNSLGKEAYATWQEYTQNEAALAALSQIENKQDELTADGAAKLGIELEEGQVLTVQQAYDMLLAKKLGLEEPCVLTAQLAIDNINSEIANIESTLNSQDFSNVDPVSVGLEIGASTEEIKTALNEKLQGLNEDKLAIATEFNIELPEEEKQKLMADLGAVEEFTINDKEFAVIANGISETQQALQDIQDFVINDKSYTVTRYEQSKISGGGNGGSSIFSRMAIAACADGTAHADGSWGAPKTETALVGELGPELLVRNGRWTTIGDNGAEFTQVKKGDIIFNHKQTEDLLSKGHITGRGKAYASGTAYSNMFGPLKPDDTQSSDYGDENGYVDNFYDNLSSSAEAAEEFEEALDWIEVRLEEWDELLGKLNAQLENAVYYTEKNNKINEIIAANQSKLADLKSGSVYYENYAAKYLAKIPAQYQAMAKNGSIAITDFVGDANEEVAEAIQKYRDYIQKAADLNQQAEEILTEIRDLAIQKIDNAYDAGSVRVTIEEAQNTKLQNAIDYDEESGLITSEDYYRAMMANSTEKITYLTQARNAMQAALDEAVKSGQIVEGSNEWYEQIEKMYGIDSEIAEATLELEQFQNAINDIYWDNFDQLISRIDYLKEETQSLIDLMANDDLVADPTKRKHDGGTVEYWTADDVKWTDEGLASLGLYAQQMEMAEYAAKQYAEAIKDLESDYAAGLYSENEYLEKLNELKEAQYDNIQAYYDAQEAIVELNEARVDSIKEGIEAEIDAYAELIEKKKEALDTEKDLYDFQKSANEQAKNISQIERQLAALANDSSMSAMAKKRQLEAELAEAKAEQEELYYDRSIEDRQNALDQELEDFQTEKELEIQKWEEYLANVEQVIAESLGVVQANASGIYDTLNQKADEYNIHLSDAIKAPWNDGALAVSDYQETFDTAMSSTTNQLDALKNKWQEVIDKMAEAAKIDLSNINAENAKYSAAKREDKKTNNSGNQSPSNSNSKQSTYTVQSGDSLWDIAKKVLGDASRWDEIYNLNRDTISIPWIIHPGQKLKLPKYAKGTTGVKNNQLAWIDEMGLEEVVLHAGDNGRLTYLSKGSAVLPSDISNNLMQLGSLDPQDILDRNRPAIAPSKSIVNTEIKIDASVGTLLYVEHLDGSNPDNVLKLVDKAWDKKMQILNNAIKSKAR